MPKQKTSGPDANHQALPPTPMQLVAWKKSLSTLVRESAVSPKPYLQRFASSPLADLFLSDERVIGCFGRKNRSILRKELLEAAALEARLERLLMKPPSKQQQQQQQQDGNQSHAAKKLVIWDLCSGKGFSAAWLSTNTFPNATIHMVDSNATINRDFLGSSSFPNVTFHHWDLYSQELEDAIRQSRFTESKNGQTRNDDLYCLSTSPITTKDTNKANDINETISAVPISANNTVVILVGIHLCGDLSRRALELRVLCHADAVFVSPCCAMRPVALKKRRPESFGYSVPEKARRFGRVLSPYQLWCWMLWGYAHSSTQKHTKTHEGKATQEEQQQQQRVELQVDSFMKTDKNVWLSVIAPSFTMAAIPARRTSFVFSAQNMSKITLIALLTLLLWSNSGISAFQSSTSSRSPAAFRTNRHSVPLSTFSTSSTALHFQLQDLIPTLFGKNSSQQQQSTVQPSTENGLDKDYPWCFKGRVWLRPALVRIDDSNAAKLVEETQGKLSLLHFLGYTIGGTVALEYDTSPVGPYREYVSMGSLVVASSRNAGIMIGQWGSRLYVSNKVAEEICQQVWAVPAEVADIEFVETSLSSSKLQVTLAPNPLADRTQKQSIQVTGWSNTRVSDQNAPVRGGIPIWWTPTLKALWVQLLPLLPFKNENRKQQEQSTTTPKNDDSIIPLHRLRLSASSLRLHFCGQESSDRLGIPFGMGLSVDNVLIEIGRQEGVL